MSKNNYLSNDLSISKKKNDAYLHSGCPQADTADLTFSHLLLEY